MGQIHSFEDFVSMVRRRFALIALVAFIGTLVSLVYVMKQQRLYEATAVVQIEAAQVADSIARPGSASSATHRLRLLEQQLMARDNLIDVIGRHGLYADAKDLSLNLKVAFLREAVRLLPITDPTQAYLSDNTPTGLMISVTLPNAQKSADIANEFLVSVLEQNRERRAQVASQTLGFFQAEAERVNAEIAALEQKVASFEKANANFLPSGISAQRDEMASLKVTLLQIEQKLIELEANRTRQRAEVINRQIELLRQQGTLISTRITEIETAISASPEVERQMKLLTRQLAQLQDEFSVITRRVTDAEMGQQLESAQRFERFEVLETAIVPDAPVSGSRKKKAALGAFLSALLGLGLAFVLEMLQPAIRTRAQLERQLNVKAVVAIPHISTPATRRNKRLIWIALMAALLAGLGMLYGIAKQGIGFISQQVAARRARTS